MHARILCASVLGALAVVVGLDAPRSFAAADFSYVPDATPAAEVVGKSENPLGKREKLLIRVPGGDPIPAFLSLPLNAAGPVPVVLLVHGAYDDKKETMISRLGTRLNAAGIACIAFDLPGHGDRATNDKSGFRQALGLLILQTAIARGQGVPPEFKMLAAPATQPAARTERLLSVISANVKNSAIDGRRVLDYVIARPEVDSKRIGIVGVSLGGGISTLIASADERVSLACLYVSGARTQFGEGKEGETVRELYAPVDPLPRARLFHKPVLMLNGKTDMVILPEESKALFEAFPGPKDIRWYDAGHNFPRSSLDDGTRWIASQFGIVLPATQPATQPAGK